jgi:hypothetical protein
MKTSIDISELRKDANGDTVKELADFLENKLANVEIDTSGSEVAIVYEEEGVFSRSYLRVLLRKFLHKSDLKDFRVIAGKEASFVLKKRREKQE